MTPEAVWRLGPFKTPDDPVGQVDSVCFAQALVLVDDRWHLHCGMADSKIGGATAPATPGATPTRTD